MLDCNLLKSSLVEHCLQWQNQLIALLNSNARNDLEGLHNKWAQDKIILTIFANDNLAIVKSLLLSLMNLKLGLSFPCDQKL